MRVVAILIGLATVFGAGVGLGFQFGVKSVLEPLQAAPRGKTYIRWSRKYDCPGCGVKGGSDHRKGCKLQAELRRRAKNA